MVKRVYLIGDVIKGLPEKKLPLLKEVMALLFYHINSKTLSIKKCISITIDKVFEIWCAAEIPTITKKGVYFKLTSIHNRWKN